MSQAPKEHYSVDQRYLWSNDTYSQAPGNPRVTCRRVRSGPSVLLLRGALQIICGERCGVCVSVRYLGYPGLTQGDRVG